MASSSPKNERSSENEGLSEHGRSSEYERPPVTVEDLTRWEEHGAIWRPLEVSDERAVVELCTCYGERVDVVRSDAPDLIAFVRAQRD
jgi:hypothetical protein